MCAYVEHGQVRVLFKSSHARFQKWLSRFRLIFHTHEHVDESAVSHLMRSQVGMLPKDKHTGKVAEVYESVLDKSGLELVDCHSGLADLLAIKDPSEVLNVKKAAMLASKVMKDFVVPQIERIVDENKKVKHSKLSTATEEAIVDPSKVNVKLRADNVDIAYPPIFQSGGNYDLKAWLYAFWCRTPAAGGYRRFGQLATVMPPFMKVCCPDKLLVRAAMVEQVSAFSDDSNLHDGVILVSIGTRYASYCANISRTYVINPTKKQVCMCTFMRGGDTNPCNRVCGVCTKAHDSIRKGSTVGGTQVVWNAPACDQIARRSARVRVGGRTSGW
eukprot:364199-Chlamydomonas_euryale.AAC.5